MAEKINRNVAVAEFLPVRRETVMEMVAGRIEALVRNGELRSGSRLPPEPKLAAMLHVSRGSLREALKGLVFLGLVRARPGDGTYIQPSLSGVISRHFKWMLLLQELKYLELLELRQILEPAAAALAARRATKDDIEKMQEALAGMRSGFHNPERFIQKRDAQGARLEVLEDLRYAEALLRRDMESQDKLRQELEHTPKNSPKARVTRRGTSRR